MPTQRTVVARAPATPTTQSSAAPAAVLKKHDGQQAEPPSAPLLQPVQLEDPAICRLCWAEAEQDDPLLSPCSCSGSLKYIHHHCLADWQRTLRAQGQGRRAHICELCKTPYRLQQDSSNSSSGQQSLRARHRQLHRRLLAAINNSLFDAVHTTPWPSLAVQLWHGYVMTHGAVQVRHSHSVIKCRTVPPWCVQSCPATSVTLTPQLQRRVNYKGLAPSNEQHLVCIQTGPAAALGSSSRAVCGGCLLLAGCARGHVWLWRWAVHRQGPH